MIDVLFPIGQFNSSQREYDHHKAALIVWLTDFIFDAPGLVGLLVLSGLPDAAGMPRSEERGMPDRKQFCYQL